MMKRMWAAASAGILLFTGAAWDRAQAQNELVPPNVLIRAKFLEVFAIGGVRSSPVEDSRFVGVDDFFGSDDLLIDGRSLNFDSSGGFAGGGFRIYGPPGSPLGLSFLPVVQPFAGASFIKFFDEDHRASFFDVGFPLATGTATFSQSFAVPLVVGSSLPLTNIGINLPGVSFEYFSGIDISHYEFRFELTEVGAFNDGTIFASESRTMVRPLIGVGFQYNAGVLPGVGGITIGANVMAITPNDLTVRARSINFPNQTYTLKRPDDDYEVRGMGTLGISFGR